MMCINQICMPYADLSLLCLASGYALSSVEGRVSMEFFDLSVSAQSKNYMSKITKVLHDPCEAVRRQTFYPTL